MGSLLVSGVEAAEYLGISWDRFKIAVWRGLGLDENRPPTGKEPKPVSGGWSARGAMYRASDIRKMHEMYPFRRDRNSEPDLKWLKSLPKVRVSGLPEPKMATTSRTKEKAFALPKRTKKTARRRKTSKGTSALI